MKKVVLVLALVLALSLSAFAEAAKTPVIKAVNAVYDYGDIKLHAYAAKDSMNDECYVAEGKDGLVILESAAYKTNVNEFAEYIKSRLRPFYYLIIPTAIKREALKSWQPGGSFVQALGGELAGQGRDS